MAIESVDRDFADRIEVGARGVGEAECDRVGPLALEDLRHLAATQGEFGVAGNLAGAQAEEGGFLAVDADMDLRDESLAFRLHIDEAGNGGDDIADLRGFFAEGVEVVAENLDRDLGLHTREEVVDAVGDGLAHAGEDAGDFGELGANFGEDFGAGAFGGGEFEFDLGGVHLLHMLVAFGATSAATDGAHLGDFAEEVFSNLADARAFLQRGAGGGEDEDGGAAFIEGREEFAAEEWNESQGAEEGGKNEGKEGIWDSEADGEDTGDEPFEKAHDRAVLRMRHAFHTRQEVGAERWGDGYGHQETGGDGNDIGESERGEDAAFDAAQGEEGDENKNDNEGGEDDGIAHLAAGREDYAGDGFGIRREAVLAQAAEDIFHIHNRVIHQLANRNGKAAEGHGVDAESKPFENDKRDQQREGNGGEGDEGRSEIQ